VAERVAGIDEAMRHRSGVFGERANVQRERFNLPAFPTTTIGSFP
jgi:5-methyltetrahydropteroyltriglutamate--homocysteine methyltransferase